MKNKQTNKKRIYWERKKEIKNKINKQSGG